MDSQAIIDIIGGLIIAIGGGAGAKSIHSNSKIKDRVKALETQISNNNNNIQQQLNKIEMHFSNFETKLEMIVLQLQIKNTNSNEININKSGGEK